METERIAVLSQTIQVWVLRKIGTQTNILLLKDERCACSVEENFAIAVTRDLEGERVCRNVETNGCSRGSSFVIGWTRQDLFLDLKHVETRIIDLDMEAIICIRVSYERGVISEDVE